jgi:hypothetical protein
MNYAHSGTYQLSINIEHPCYRTEVLSSLLYEITHFAIVYHGTTILYRHVELFELLGIKCIICLDDSNELINIKDKVF